MIDGPTSAHKQEGCGAPHTHQYVKLTLRNRSAFPMTETELNVIAAVSELDRQF